MTPSLSRVASLVLICAFTVGCGGTTVRPASQAPAGLESQVSVAVDQCADDGARGTMTNASSKTLSVYVDIHFLSSSGSVIEDSTTHETVAPGDSKRWDVGYFGDGDVASCEADISSAFAQ